MSGSSGLVDKQGRPVPVDPFARGTWIYCVADGKSMLAMIDGSDQPNDEQTQEACVAELMEHRSLAVTLRRKYVLTLTSFPMQNPGKQITSAMMITPGKHETLLEMSHDFPTLAVVTSVTFLSDFHPDDQEMWRQFVRMADAAQEQRVQALRASRSGLVVPTVGSGGNGVTTQVR